MNPKLFSKRIVIVGLTFVSLLIAALSIHLVHRQRGAPDSMRKKSITVALPHDWNAPLYPASQRALIEEAIMSHVFEPLVMIGGNGLIMPRAAKAHKFNDNFTRFEFKIDTTRKFSDGSRLTSLDFKKSWERGMLMAETSWNKNLLDVLSFVTGTRKTDAGISFDGVETPDDETLTVSFSKPMRSALVYLSGTRFAAFKEHDGQFIGTGRYAFENVTSTEAKVKLNNYNSEPTDFEEVRFVADVNKDSYAKLLNGDIDIIAFNRNSYDHEPDFIGETNGIEDIAYWLHLNGLQGRFFSDINMRKAMLALVEEVLFEHRADVEGVPTKFRVDFQPYLPLQAGRISERRAHELIAGSKPLIDELIARSQKEPLKLAIGGFLKKIVPMLQQKGLVFTHIEPEDSLKEFYKIHSADAVVSGASIHVTDSDGLYHLLGKNGAITSPMIYNEVLDNLLVEGRKILSLDKLAPHYELVGEALLTEVPTIHLGYVSNNLTYRSDRLKLTQAYFERKYDKIWNMFQRADGT